MMQKYSNSTPPNIDDLLKLSRDKTNYKNRLKAVEELGKWKCRQSIDKLWRLMISDKVYSVQRNAFLKLQLFGEKVKLPKKKKGHLVKDINKKLLKIYNTFQAEEYTLTDFKLKFKQEYPEIYDIYAYEKQQNFDKWIETVVQHSPKKKLKNSYRIIIKLSPSDSETSEKEIFSEEIPYKSSSGNVDELKVTNKTIEIKAERTAIINPKDILENDVNTIHVQVIKSLLFYYLYFGRFIEISSIKITREKTSILQEYNLPNKDTPIQQVLNDTFSLDKNLKFSIQQLKPIFLIDEKSNALFNATSYLLKALSTDESSNKFEKLWKAFNSIYRYIGKSENENECHRKLRHFLTDNSSLFSQSTNKVSKLNKTVLRKKLRLRDLILNDYKTKNHTVTYLSFIYRYSDYRIAELLKETLVYREEFLKDIFAIDKVESKFNKLTNITPMYHVCKNDSSPHCIYKMVTEYLQKNIDNKTISDIEVIAFICIKYSYFIRNKIFHAEKHDLSFRFIDNYQVDEIIWINDILQTLVIELLQNNDKWN
jgi:hypothetical protein